MKDVKCSAKVNTNVSTISVHGSLLLLLLTIL